MEDTSPHETLSDIIERRIKEVDREAIKYIKMFNNFYGGMKIHEYALALKELLKQVQKKALEDLPEIKELVKNSEVDEYYIDVFYAIVEYLRRRLYLTDDDKTKLKEGLKLLLDECVSYDLRKLDWDTRMGKTLPEVEHHIDQINNYLKDIAGEGLDPSIKSDIREDVARKYLFRYINCLLSNPEGYMQHLKSGDLEDFIRESCKPAPS
jgi:hypothetical protein